MAATHFSGPIVLGSDSVEVLSAADTLTADESGKIFFLDGAAGATITLPTLAAGMRFKFVVAGQDHATTDWIIDSAEGDNIYGQATVNGAAVAAVAEDQVNLVASTAVMGDWVELWGDSSNSKWYVMGQGVAAGSITFTDPS